ncbi:MAG: hypothetical protein GTO45_21510 [Candidatus Aminicenantes bacterium]|nr:hypothetical protein [Candidatus Aminicenantes bacterium]NIN20744.1 hypothetical protein [Candidatus Aminicenantes bacterium]NIN44522.1 hypothetical protein [Candidatus Aminicenantes bacterium]NIN87342.1 hypothetical protein [Candidatus Aminicenantes bacterium]NIO83643.1 hypothetical protein [Candidatus Aminicenantes bacterium]
MKEEGISIHSKKKVIDALKNDLIEKTSMEYMDFYELSLQYIRDIVYDGN